jgi:hypothetical protein
MLVYYASLWAISLLNVLRCVLQMTSNSGASTGHAALWNACWLLTRFGMIMLEACVVVFLLQGHSASGRKVRAGCGDERACCSQSASAVQG